MLGPVSWKYEMNPETEKTVSGTELKNGMVVLIESRILRNSESAAAYRDTNRWCEVSHLLFEGNGLDGLVSFVGVYEDGSSAHRSYSTNWAWLVKKDSFDVEKDRREKISEIVKSALTEYDAVSFHKHAGMNRISEDAVDEIMKLF